MIDNFISNFIYLYNLSYITFLYIYIYVSFTWWNNDITENLYFLCYWYGRNGCFLCLLWVKSHKRTLKIHHTGAVVLLHRHETIAVRSIEARFP